MLHLVSAQKCTVFNWAVCLSTQLCFYYTNSTRLFICHVAIFRCPKIYTSMQQDATIKKLYAGWNELLGHMPQYFGYIWNYCWMTYVPKILLFAPSTKNTGTVAAQHWLSILMAWNVSKNGNVFSFSNPHNESLAEREILKKKENPSQDQLHAKKETCFLLIFQVSKTNYKRNVNMMTAICNLDLRISVILVHLMPSAYY
jgi:hypothetical protein